MVDQRKSSVAMIPATKPQPAVSALRSAGVDEARLPTSVATPAEREVARLKKEIVLLEGETMGLMKQQFETCKQQILARKTEIIQAESQLAAAQMMAAAEQRAQNGALVQARQFLRNVIASISPFVASFVATLPFPGSVAQLVLQAQLDAKQRQLAAAETDLKNMLLAMQQLQARFDLAKQQRAP
jgi:hypothetical protein